MEVATHIASAAHCEVGCAGTIAALDNLHSKLVFVETDRTLRHTFVAVLPCLLFGLLSTLQ
jgi:hypothetical protein